MSAVVIIPARYASTRLPGKPLLAETGLPLICHVMDRAAQARGVERVIVATDDERIAQAVRAHGGTAVMTRADHPNGTCRIAEAAAGLPDRVDVVVNVQGDEPEIDPRLIERLIERLRAGDEPMATAASRFGADQDASDPNVVKVVTDQRGRAMYFSRARIPHDRDGGGGVPVYKHAGVYAYRRSFLPVYVSLAPTPCETAEKLEQLRALEHGHAIAVVEAESDHPGIDTPAQYAAFVERWRQTHR